ncbi:unnamed protein product [Calypogeia fissa]
MEAGGSDGGAAAGAGATAAGIAGGGSGGNEGNGGSSNGSSNGSNNSSSSTSLMTAAAAVAAVSAVPSAADTADDGAGVAARPQPAAVPPATTATTTTSAAAASSSPVAGLAKEAAMLFKAQRYAECLHVLEQLLQKKEDDPKVLHNIAVAEYYRDGCTEPQKLLDVLAKVKGRSEELARAEEEQLEGIGTASSSSQSVSSSTGPRSSTTATGGSGGQGQPAALAGSGLGGGDAIAYMEDYDTSIPTLNTAVIFYHMQQYATALSVLEPLYQNIEPIDETAALRVCMLMLDITLASGQPLKAAAVLQTMEKSFGYLLAPADGGTSVQSQPPIQTQLLNSAGVGLASSGSALSSGGPSSLMNSPSGELGLTRTSSEEVLDEDSLSLSLDVEGSVRSVPSLPISTALSRVPNVEKVLPAPVVDLKLMLHLYKVRLLMLTRNLKATKREVKSALNLSRDHLTALVLKAQLEYSRANYRKAIKLLSTWSSRVEPGMSAMFLSNLGCIHHQLQKNQTAAVFFRKALQANATLSKESLTKLNTFSQDKSLSILYNAGLQQLVCGNPVLAACCFQEAGSLYYNQPLLWLRLAECCIMALEKGILDSANENSIPGKRDEIKVSVIGDGKWRRVVLPAGSLNPTATNGLYLEGNNEGEENYNADQAANNVEGTGAALARPQKLSMAFACQCLYTALHLLDKRDAKAAEAAAAVAAEVVDVTDVDDVTNSTGSQSQKDGTTEKKGNITPASGGTSSQVSPNGDGKESKGTSGTSGTITAAIATFEEEKRKEHLVIRQAVLADLAYVQLCLQNPLQALKTASTLLSQPDCSQIYAFLGRLYAAESLCLLDRSREAVDYLSVCLMENSTVESTVGSEEDGQKWKSGDNSEASGDGEDSASVSPYALPSGAEDANVAKATGSRARSSLYVNLAAVYVMQGDLAQARQWATQAVAITPANPLAVLAVVYVDLLSGQREDAINMLKRCRHLCVVSHNKVLWQKD